jgi:hypothetical protein
MVGVALNHESNGKSPFPSWNRIAMQDLNVTIDCVCETLVSYASCNWWQSDIAEYVGREMWMSFILKR